jgi:hypothetical protein
VHAIASCNAARVAVTVHYLGEATTSLRARANWNRRISR